MWAATAEQCSLFAVVIRTEVTYIIEGACKLLVKHNNEVV